MQDESGLKMIFSVPRIYAVFQNLVGARRARRWLAENFWKVNGQEKLVDMGCGPGVIVDVLPQGTGYVGFDVSAHYIRTAQNRFGGKGTFIVGAARDFLEKPDDRLLGADLVLCNGVLHHLDDGEAIDTLRLAKQIMKPTGRLVCFENTFLVHQGRLSKWIIAADRGRNVRTEQEWKELVSRVFECFSTSIATGLLRIPYVHIIIECTKNGVTSDATRATGPV